MSKSKDPELQEPVSYPRAETKPKDPDPIPTDRWLALGRALVAVGFLTHSVQTRGVGTYTLLEGVATLVILAVCYAAGLGYRVGFGIFSLFGVFTAFGTFLALQQGTFWRLNGLIGAGNVYAVLFTAYAIARYFRFLPRRA